MKLICATAALAALIGSPVFAACVEPTAPGSLPDGNTATMQEMVATQQAIVALNNATNSYIDCLKKEHDAAIAAAGDGISTRQKDQLDKDETTKQNHAVDTLNQLAGRFNEQVRIFKAKNAAPAKAEKKG